MARERITITLPAEMIQTIDELAAAEGANRSQQVERMIRAGVGPGTGTPDFHKTIELHGRGDEIMPLVCWVATPSDEHQIHLDREWIVRFYTKVRPGEVPFGGLQIRGKSMGEEPE